MVTHELALHAGPCTVMAILAESYYIPSLKRLLKKVSRQCVSCQKAYARTSQQMMGELPAARTRPARHFSITGIDFAGLFYYKEGNRRKSITTKCYICVYICFVTKATFFDVVADLSTEAFLASLRRFTALYELPHDIYSDNGTNFVGASAELQRQQEVLEANESKEQISHWAASKGVSWHFSPGHAPHFGGLWEAAVRAMKMTIRKVIGEQKLRHDELTTLLYEASAVLNSRPLTPLDTLAADGIAPLTPGHFPIGGPPAALPSKPDIDFKSTVKAGSWLNI